MPAVFQPNTRKTASSFSASPGIKPWSRTQLPRASADPKPTHAKTFGAPASARASRNAMARSCDCARFAKLLLPGLPLAWPAHCTPSLGNAFSKSAILLIIGKSRSSMPGWSTSYGMPSGTARINCSSTNASCSASDKPAMSGGVWNSKTSTGAGNGCASPSGSFVATSPSTLSHMSSAESLRSSVGASPPGLGPCGSSKSMATFMPLPSALPEPLQTIRFSTPASTKRSLHKSAASSAMLLRRSSISSGRPRQCPSSTKVHVGFALTSDTAPSNTSEPA
mmetsp:Transcript_101818/g.294656  ORF Transcript_101818/g.294656 Transcript_101818/m.294656 type:complete len:280 (+) Transcript_101818:1633-2472(+)